MSWESNTCRTCGDRFSYLNQQVRGHTPQYCPSCLHEAVAQRERRQRQRLEGETLWRDVEATCRNCGQAFSYRRRGSGRPRAYCERCRPLAAMAAGKLHRAARPDRARLGQPDEGTVGDHVDLEYF